MGVDFEAPNRAIQNGNIPKLPRPPRPNYNKIHTQPLPVKTYPLPPLIPHNPLSLLHIAFTYLFHLIFPPSSHPLAPRRGYFSAETRSIHVIDEKTARVLWEHGFFGKGSLSRSEPAWLEREKIRQGLVLGNTSEEATRKRREERKQFKTERARKEREAIEEKLVEEATGTNNVNRNGDIEQSVATQFERPFDPADVDHHDPPSVPSPEVEGQLAVPPSDVASEISHLQLPTKTIINQEHLQLTFEEAFFLIYAVGVLEIQDPLTSQVIATSRLLSICRSYSYFPPKSPSSLAPDDPFLLSYVVYHHFRSLGWVVRPGIKFGVDHLLYNRGPVFTHAEFAVIVLPSYNNAYWSSTAELFELVTKKQTKTWWWLHCVNRVQAQVKKTLVMAYVEVPPPASDDESIINEDGDVVDIGGFLKRYRVRELILKRWTLNRNKD
ncbi:MAG: hypothetical protein Q9171_002843 [Xanthocarpia ochracea]